MRRLWLLGLWVMSGAAHASALQALQSFIASTSAAQGEFEQKVYDRQRRLKQEASGTLAFARPGRFRWTYAQPYPQLIVGDGEKLWIYDQDLNQVTVRRLDKALGATPAALLAGSKEIERAFSLSESGTRDGLEWLEAKPREKDSGFEIVRMGFGAEGLEAMELVDGLGQTTVLRFKALRRNPKLDFAQFRFVPPKGADVVGE